MAGWVNELLCKCQLFDYSFASSFIIDTMLYCYVSFTVAGTVRAKGAIAPSNISWNRQDTFCTPNTSWNRQDTFCTPIYRSREGDTQKSLLAPQISYNFRSPCLYNNRISTGRACMILFFAIGCQSVWINSNYLGTYFNWTTYPFNIVYRGFISTGLRGST